MAVEPRRGCGFRKIGGLYFVGGGRTVFCDRLPILLEVCPTCAHGIKQTRGFTWVNAEVLVDGVHPNCKDNFPCPLCMAPGELGRCGLLWIGERFYKTPAHFDREAMELGISRRISAIPRGFKVGETWILFAHPKAIASPLSCGECGRMMQKAAPDIITARDVGETILHCGVCGFEVPIFRPGIFKMWRPEWIEKILPESWKINPNHFDEIEDLVEKGITPVFVPDDDPDHQGTVYLAIGNIDEDEEENGGAQ